jgi:transcriptional regulator with XRE-family HTH domain
MPVTNGNQLGTYLKDRRAKLDPAALGFPMTRRRTPGLRREEVAQRANVSATWYTWLEQGRGGSPSTDVLNRISRALMLTAVEREHLFLVALGHPPEVRYQATEGISPRIQRVLDALEFSPSFVKTETLVDELRRLSPEFDLLWRDNDVRSQGEGIKQFRHPVAGLLALEYSAFSVDGRPDLSLVIYNPATPKDVNRIRELMKSTPKTKPSR